MGARLFERGLDPQPAGVNVYILPAQCKQFVPARSSRERQRSKHIERMAVESFEQFSRPIRLQDFLLLIRCRGRLDGFGYVVADDAPRLRLSERPMQDAMNHLHGPGCQARTAYGGVERGDLGGSDLL
jgi:hypothetical protein